MMDMRRKMTKFTPFDRVLDGLEQEDLIDDDHNMKIIKVFNKKKNHKMFLLEKLIFNEKDHLRYIDEIHKYEVIQTEGVLTIDKWTYDMIIDQNLNKQYKFILVFDTYAQNLHQYLETVSAKKLQLLKEDIVVLFKVIIQSLAYLYSRQYINFNPICTQTIVLCSDTNAKYNCLPILMTNQSLERAKKEALLYMPPEMQAPSKEQKSLLQVYQGVIYSFGLIFIQIFLMRNIDQLNQKAEVVKQCLKDIQQKYGDTFKNYIEAMIEPDPNKRIKLQELNQMILSSEPQKTIHNNLKITFSETFEFYRKSYEIMGDGQARAIAIGIPWSRLILLSNLFNIKNYFLELIDLQITSLIPENAVTVVFQNFRVLIMGGLNSRFVYELDDEVPTLKQKATFPSCTTNRWGFGYVVQEKNCLFTCSGYVDQVLTNQCYKLDLESFIWQMVPNCHKPGFGCSLVEFNEFIFKYGGQGANGKPLDVIEKFDQSGWRTVNFRQPVCHLPSFSLAVQVNPAQIFIFGGDSKISKILVLNVDLQAHIVEKREDFVYIEFLINEFLDFGKFGTVQQIQISNNQLFLLQKKDEKHQYLTAFEQQQGFVEVRKMHI